MAIEVETAKKDGRVETFTPHRYSDGSFRVEIRVADESKMIELAKDGCAVRMKGDIDGRVNLKKFK